MTFLRCQVLSQAMFTKVPMKLNIPIIGWKDCKTAIISGPTTGTTRNSSTIQKHLPKLIQKKRPPSSWVSEYQHWSRFFPLKHMFMCPTWSTRHWHLSRIFPAARTFAWGLVTGYSVFAKIRSANLSWNVSTSRKKCGKFRELEIDNGNFKCTQNL